MESLEVSSCFFIRSVLFLPDMQEMWGEAAKKLADVVNDNLFRSLEGKSKHQLWLELCDIITKHPDQVKHLKVDAILRSGIRNFKDEVRHPFPPEHLSLNPVYSIPLHFFSWRSRGANTESKISLTSGYIFQTNQLSIAAHGSLNHAHNGSNTVYKAMAILFFGQKVCNLQMC